MVAAIAARAVFAAAHDAVESLPEAIKRVLELGIDVRRIFSSIGLLFGYIGEELFDSRHSLLLRVARLTGLGLLASVQLPPLLLTLAASILRLL